MPGECLQAYILWANIRWQLTSTCYLHFSPGRFFAVSELKAMLAYVLLNYDIKLPGDGSRPPNFWFSANCIPNPTGEVMFKKRTA